MANMALTLWGNARKLPDKTALVFGDAEISFAQLHLRVQHAAAGLKRAGFVAGDKLGVMLPTGLEFIVFEYAAFTLGGALVPLNVHYMPAELEYAIDSCQVDHLVIQDEFASRLSSELLARLVHLRLIILLGDGWETDRIHDPRLRKASVILDDPEVHAEPAACRLEDLALMLYTSATTGKAKGVRLSIGNLQANYDRTPGWLGLSHDDRILCALPLYNTFALNQCINAIMVTGATLVLLPKFDVLQVLKTIQQRRITFFPAVPTMLQKLLNDPQANDFDISSVKRLLVGAAPVPAPLVEQVYRSMGRDTVVMTGYGLTEASALVSLEHTELDSGGNLTRPKSVGKPLPGILMKIVSDEGLDALPMVVGQIVIKGPNVMQGYHNKPAESAAAVVDGWLQTGDLGMMDAEGFFYVVDRKKDLIIRGGQNIYPAEIEEQLYSHPGVAEAAVIGREDEVFGEVPEAYVALKPGASATPEELMGLCRAQLAYFKVPKAIHVIDELPKGPTGKILRRELRPRALT